MEDILCIGPFSFSFSFLLCTFLPVFGMYVLACMVFVEFSEGFVGFEGLEFEGFWKNLFTSFVCLRT